MGAVELLSDPFIQKADANGRERLLEVILEASEIRKRKGNGKARIPDKDTRRSSDSDSEENGTIKKPNGESNTGTMVQQSDSTLQFNDNFSSLVISNESENQMNSAFKNYLNQETPINGQYQRMPPNPDSITSQFRDVLNGSSLNQYSTTDLRHFLDMLDPMLAQDIDETMKSYEIKKKPIIEALKAKRQAR